MRTKKLSAAGGSSPGGEKNKGGRPVGAATRRAMEVLDKVLNDGKQTPLEFMLETMRDKKMPMAIRMDAAKSAGTYMHPRFNPLRNMDGDDDNSIVNMQGSRRVVVVITNDPDAE